MTITEKIQKFMDERGLNLADFGKLSAIPKSNLSEILNGNRDVTLSVLKRAADAMGTTMDYLDDDRAGWPPPSPDDRIVLSAAERRVLSWARDVSSGDPDMEEARLRLLLIGYGKLARDLEIEQVKPGGESYGDRGQPQLPKPSKNPNRADGGR